LMKIILTAMVAAPLLYSGLLLGQDNLPATTATSTPQNGTTQNGTTQTGMRSWTGLLVASACNATGMESSRATTSADRMSDATMAKKTSSPHETNTTYEQKVNEADRNSTSQSAASTGMPKTTGSEASTPSEQPSGDQGWARAQEVANQMPDSCRITTGTTAYALRLRDGRTVRFDDASNSRIQQQLQSGGRLAHQKKIFRVVVKGTMEGDTISLDSIRI
jgi:hypothetical protein